MKHDTFYNKIVELLTLADVQINGEHPWDIHVHNEKLYARVLSKGSIALGESYMDGWWECERLDEFFYRILRAKLDTKVISWTDMFAILKAKIFNAQKLSRAYRIGKHHYDIGNRLYWYMLDHYMNYSCGYWENAKNLDEAQEAKLDLICRKLDLQPGMRLLDIGCGWGGMAKFAAERYQAKVIGITVSKKQAEFAKEFCKGLPVEIRLQDYRDLKETFDRVVSIGMFEHVGYKNYKTFMQTVRNCLTENGLLLLHTIGGLLSVVKTDPWINTYIFPNSMLPSAQQICQASEGLFVLEDWHNFGADYDKTLMQWFKNFDEHWNQLKDSYSMRFYRMWKYYLLSCAGSFRARSNQLWQIVFSPEGIPGGYHSIR
ncbi:cyclopropane-fatty-acyl-phospholipid synthase [Candidatus Vecturithrix granuli]|uniref:Cyclopropane-fatty-acyl-phospholipid synthase n=1 Tax=Vecturithrix granuli TaxID=1499967 RepID=A0A081C6S7_VECG1|nr:cyclopropane-fatty-acyl-phospholipid synthase [Candidatus Vecturithrix granuli]